MNMRASHAVLSIGFLLMTLAAPQRPAAPADEGSDKETMRKQLLKMGVPQAQIDQILQQLDEKLKEGGLNQETRDSLMLQRRRDVTIDVDWKVESHPFWSDVTYPCGRDGKKPATNHFWCRYNARGHADFASLFEYLPFSETERIVSGSDLGQAQIRIRQKVTLRPVNSMKAAVEGACKPQEQRAYAWDVSSNALGETDAAPAAGVGAELVRRDKSLDLAFRGALVGKIRGTPFHQNQPVDVAGFNVPFKDGIVQVDYSEFFRALMQTGHYRHTFRWTQPGNDSPEDQGGEVELDLHVALKGGPAPGELAPAPQSASAAPAQPAGGSPAPPH